MKLLIAAVLTAVAIFSHAQSQLPMASFHVTVKGAEDATAVWDKIRVSLLSNGYAFTHDKNQNVKNYALTSDPNVRVMLTRNAGNGFVEVVFFHYRKPSFGEAEEKRFEVLKQSVIQAVKDHEITDGVPFRRGKSSN